LFLSRPNVQKKILTMKITLCGSIAFIGEMLDAKKKLEAAGHKIQMPPLEVPDEKGNMIPVKEYWDMRKSTNMTSGWLWDRKEESIRNHFGKIEWADAILVFNYSKNNIENYIGGNTFLEMGHAFHNRKPIYLLNPIPEILYKEEILGMKPILVSGNLALIK